MDLQLRLQFARAAYAQLFHNVCVQTNQVHKVKLRLSKMVCPPNRCVSLTTSRQQPHKICSDVSPAILKKGVNCGYASLVISKAHGLLLLHHSAMWNILHAVCSYQCMCRAQKSLPASCVKAESNKNGATKATNGMQTKHAFFLQLVSIDESNNGSVNLLQFDPLCAL